MYPDFGASVAVLQKNEIMIAMPGLLNAKKIQIESEPAVEGTLFIWKDYKADFSD